MNKLDHLLAVAEAAQKEGERFRREWEGVGVYATFLKTFDEDTVLALLAVARCLEKAVFYVEAAHRIKPDEPVHAAFLREVREALRPFTEPAA